MKTLNEPLLNDFAAFILTHGRPDKVITYDSLRSHGYTGKIFLIIDDLDKTRDQYIEKYGDQVIIFDKKLSAKHTDQGDNTTDLRSVVYARNALVNIAKDMGIKYFIELDDDYNDYRYRFSDKLEYIPACKKARNLDQIFEAMVRFMDYCPQVYSIAMAQGGDFIGGRDNPFAQKVGLKRKCMNSFVCATDRPFDFVCKMNDDVTTYVRLGAVGKLFFTTNQVSLNQATTQANAGGMTEIYLAQGTYVKSFFSVMFNPSSVKVRMLHGKNTRLHHSIKWDNAVPKIVSESLKKKGTP
jgi:hypothetical protein